MTTPHLQSVITTQEPAPPARRGKAREEALAATFAALRAEGIAVEKVCIKRGQVEIHCGPIAAAAPAKKDRGLKEW